MLAARQPVFEVRDDIIEQLVNLGFKNEEEIRRQILDNECCQVVTMYHLILDRKVAEELAEVKQNMLAAGAQQPSSPTKVPLQGKPIPGKLPPMNPLKLSPLRTPSALASIVEEEVNEISAAEWDKIQQTEKEEVDQQDESVACSEPIPLPQPNYHHQQHDGHTHRQSAPESRHTGPSLLPDRRVSQPSHPGPQHHRGDRSQLSSSVPGLNFADKARHRRYSVATTNDQMIHDRSLPHTPAELNAKTARGQQRKEVSQSHDGAPVAPRGRKFSLDSRAIAEQKVSVLFALGCPNTPQQMAQEHGGQGAPRLVKGVFKASTTTTRPPAEAAKLVKKVLGASSFFVKRKSPYIFECFDDESGVKFQLEVCKISQLDMTGIHLKRLVGDIWVYKNMCTSVVNKLSL